MTEKIRPWAEFLHKHFYLVWLLVIVIAGGVWLNHYRDHEPMEPVSQYRD